MKCRLVDVCDNVYSGGTPKSSNTSYYGGNIPWLRTQEINFADIYKTETFITQEGYEASSAKWVPKNAIITAMYGATAGKSAITKIPLTTNQACCNLVIDRSKADYRYVYYYLLHNYEILKGLANGGAQQNLNSLIIKNFEIDIPQISIQHYVSDILSVFDRKIENNIKINHHLEQMAQAIFKAWFVDFEPFGSVMPDDWREGTLSEIATITMGQSPDGSSYNEDGIGTVFYQGRAEFGSRFPTRRLFTTQPKRMAAKGDVLMSVRAPVGDVNVAYESCCLGRGLVGIQSNNSCQSFILYTMFALKQQLDMFNGEGTVFGSINKNDMATLPVLIPSDEVLRQFEELVNPMDATIEANYAESSNLQAARDSLLPRLMSGELSVADLIVTK